MAIPVRFVDGRFVLDPPRITVLVIASSNLGIYAEHEACWRSYARSHPLVTVYFIRQREDVNDTYLDGDTIWSTGKEGTERVFEKTIAAMRFLPSSSYDYLVRTNLSSVWNFSALLHFCSNLRRDQIYCGVLGNPGVSGAGIILTPDVVRVFVENAHRIERSTWDDIDFGNLAHLCNIPTKAGSRYDPRTRAEVDNCWSLGYHYYLKHQVDGYRDIETEIDIMKYLISMIYRRRNSSGAI